METTNYYMPPTQGQQIKAYGFANGVNIGLDYGPEKYVKLVRDGIGKIKHHGNKGKIEHTSFCRMGK
jgi:hypothetical protein